MTQKKWRQHFWHKRRKRREKKEARIFVPYIICLRKRECFFCSSQYYFRERNTKKTRMLDCATRYTYGEGSIPPATKGPLSSYFLLDTFSRIACDAWAQIGAKRRGGRTSVASGGEQRCSFFLSRGGGGGGGGGGGIIIIVVRPSDDAENGEGEGEKSVAALRGA